MTVTGSGFVGGAGGTQFMFGSSPATNARCATSTTCVVVAPPHEQGKVAVVAMVNSIPSPRTRADQFTYR